MADESALKSSYFLGGTDCEPVLMLAIILKSSNDRRYIPLILGT